MAHKINETAGRSHDGRRLDSNSADRSSSLKSESLTAFTLAAGAIGLGISMMESQKAEAAEKAEASENADASANSHAVAAGSHQAAIEGQDLAYQSHGVVPLATAETSSGAEIAGLQERGQEPARLTETTPTKVDTPSDAQGHGAHISNDSTESLQGAASPMADTGNPNSTAQGSHSNDAAHTIGSGGHTIEVSTGDSSQEVGGAHLPFLGNASGTPDHSLHGVTDTVGDVVSGVTDGLGDTLGGVTDALGDVTSGLTAGLGDTVHGVTDTVGDVVSGVTDGLGDTLGGVTNVVSGSVGGLENMLSGVMTSQGPILGGSDVGSTDIVLNFSVQESGMPTSSIGQALTDIFDAAHDALGNMDGIFGSLVPDLTFLGQSLVYTEEHHDLSNSHGSLLNGFL